MGYLHMPKVSKSKNTTPKKAAKPSVPTKARQVTERQKAVVGPRNVRAVVKKTSAPPKKAAAPTKKVAPPAKTRVMRAPKKVVLPAPRRVGKSPDLAARRGRPRKNPVVAAPPAPPSAPPRPRGRPRKTLVAGVPPADTLSTKAFRKASRAQTAELTAGLDSLSSALSSVTGSVAAPRRTGNSRKSAQPPVTPT